MSHASMSSRPRDRGTRGTRGVFMGSHVHKNVASEDEVRTSQRHMPLEKSHSIGCNELVIQRTSSSPNANRRKVITLTPTAVTRATRCVTRATRCSHLARRLSEHATGEVTSHKASTDSVRHSHPCQAGAAPAATARDRRDELQLGVTGVTGVTGQWLACSSADGQAAAGMVLGSTLWGPPVVKGSKVRRLAKK